MRELSLNLLDIAENSVKAGATLVEMDVTVQGNVLTMSVKDNGSGMDKEFLATVRDPYTTTRKTRKVGMGIPLFSMVAEMSGGTFDIQSELGVGTCVTATFAVDHIDRPPLGDLAATVVTLLSDSVINNHTTVDFVLRYSRDGAQFLFDTRELRAELGDIPLDEPEIICFIKSLITDNMEEINGGMSI